MITFSKAISEESLRRSVEISLLSWRKAEPDDETDDKKYGYWGDSFPPKDGALIGSRLWLLFRSKLIDNETLLKAEDYIRQALQWMIDDDLVSQIDVALRREGNANVVGNITLHVSNGEAILIPFTDIWNVNYAV